MKLALYYFYLTSLTQKPTSLPGKNRKQTFSLLYAVPTLQEHCRAYRDIFFLESYFRFPTGGNRFRCSIATRLLSGSDCKVDATLIGSTLINIVRFSGQAVNSTLSKDVFYSFGIRIKGMHIQINDAYRINTVKGLCLILEIRRKGGCPVCARNAI